jgi:hypothetical protein
VAAHSASITGALPLLSHALLSTWELSRTGTITVADYRASGGISDAITRTAEGVFTGLSAEEQEMARRLFLRLVHVADDAPPTRSVVRLAELDSWSASAVGLLGRFVDERLITVDADSAQIAHQPGRGHGGRVRGRGPAAHQAGMGQLRAGPGLPGAVLITLVRGCPGFGRIAPLRRPGR